MLITLKPLIYKTLKNVKLRLRSVQVFVLLMCNFQPFFGQEMVHKEILVIDPGHGGMDSGAIGINGVKEKDVALSVAREIVRWNHSLLDGKYDIYLTRYTDTLISLGDRSKLAKALQADVFVSLHCNHAENPEAKGMEVFVHNSHNSYSKESLALGVSILNEVVQNLGIRNRNVKSDNFHVLRENTFCPSVLVEMAFLSHRDEADYILRIKSIRALALAILLGIDNLKFEKT
ncbi:N-acetylmuramoyl-L-alanine amidase family protein [Flagellimonas sp.]|uniref:N-acetylmuramoyl-L-alanine amidase family protein n=1 Tax=Flagellimonas sp. TaxID=2058762 RepID=UPI003BB0E819